MTLNETPSEKEDSWLMFKTIFGTSVTAFTIYSHIDTIINISKSMQWLAGYWRELIALPWIWIGMFFGFDIPKTMAGFLTVLLGTTFIVLSASSETRIRMKPLFRIYAILVSSCVGFLYAIYIAIPALHDAPNASYELTNLVIQMLAEIFYTDVENMEVTSPWVPMVYSSIIAVILLLLMSWPYRSSVSMKSMIRSWFGVGLLVLFCLVLADRLIYSFLPLSLNDGAMIEMIIESVAMATVLFAVMFGPFVSSVYLSDPATIAKRNISILSIIVAVFVLDVLAYLIESALQLIITAGST